MPDWLPCEMFCPFCASQRTENHEVEVFVFRCHACGAAWLCKPIPELWRDRELEADILHHQEGRRDA